MKGAAARTDQMEKPLRRESAVDKEGSNGKKGHYRNFVAPAGISNGTIRPISSGRLRFEKKVEEKKQLLTDLKPSLIQVDFNC